MPHWTTDGLFCIFCNYHRATGVIARNNAGRPQGICSDCIKDVIEETPKQQKPSLEQQLRGEPILYDETGSKR